MQKRQAITLVETLTVLAILSILATILTVSVLSVFEKQKEVRIETELVILLQAAQAYEQRYPHEPLTSINRLVETGCLANDLTSPVDGYDYAVAVQAGEIRTSLQQNDVVYERGDFHAEKSTPSIHND